MNKKMKKVKILRVKVKKGKIQRKKIPAIYRTAVIVVLAILALSSLYSAAAITGDEAKTMEKTVPVVSYSQNANFNYIAHLINNTVYDFTTIHPGRATIFKQITDYFEMSISYQFNCAQATTISGSYTLIAEIQTEDNIWTRTYTLTPQTTFSNDSFDIDFDLNLAYYESILSDINNEIGITATNPTLAIICKITLTSETPEGNIFEYFEPTLSIPLTGNIININNPLSQRETGQLTEKVKVNIPEEDVSGERNGSLLLAGLFALPILPVAIFTQNDDIKLSQIDKQIKKIKKKYGEWIVEVNKLPRRPDNAEVIHMRSMDDLVKISEELGKPVITYKSHSQGYAFIIFDENIHYIYLITDN